MLGYQNQSRTPNTNQNQTQTQSKTKPTPAVAAAGHHVFPGHPKPQQLASSYKAQDEPTRVNTTVPGNVKTTQTARRIWLWIARIAPTICW